MALQMLDNKLGCRYL